MSAFLALLDDLAPYRVVLVVGLGLIFGAACVADRRTR